jgi:hypothetical protein
MAELTPSRSGTLSTPELSPEFQAPARSLNGPAEYAAWAVHRAARAVERGEQDRDEAIHEVRLTVKRLRALWRLVRPQVGAPLATRENATLREAARRLGGIRDDRVIADTLDLLLRRARGAAVRSQGAALRESLFADSAVEPGFQDALTDGLRIVRASAAVIAVLPWESWSWTAMSPGLVRSYRRSGLRMRDCAAKRDNPAFHEWRKRVKDLQYQLEMAVFAWASFRPVQREFRELGRLLGEAQDLAILRTRLISEAGRTSANPAPQLVRALDRQLGKLKDRTLLRGLALFHLSPRDWLRSLKPK